MLLLGGLTDMSDYYDIDESDMAIDNVLSELLEYAKTLQQD